MSIINKVKFAIKHFNDNELDGAFSNACIAVDAIAKIKYPKINKNNERFKVFIRSNMKIICNYGLPGISASQISFSFQHSSIKGSRKSGRATIEEIIYHIIRCEYLHEAKLDSKIIFCDETHIGDDEKNVYLPRRIVIGLIAAVINNLNESKEELLAEIDSIQ